MKNIPVIHVAENSLAEAYESALIKLYSEGTRFRTQYDKPDDPMSIDCTMNITVTDPETDPMIHMAFPGGIDELKEYVMELKGYKDHWVKNMNDPSDTRWEYTYHGRLVNYGLWKERDPGSGRSVMKGTGIDQVEYIINKLVKQPYTRQAQMITWMPQMDTNCYDPPCLQSLWYRIIDDEEGTQWLNCNVRFRSNDAWNASFMNMFGFIQFNREIIAGEIENRTGRKVKLGRLNWQADSYHIYGKDIAQAREMLFDRIEVMPFGNRILNFNDPFIRDMYDDAGEKIIDKIKEFDKLHPSYS